jgi:hydrogenase-4 component E
MTQYSDFLLLIILALNMYIVATGNLLSGIKAMAFQGMALAFLPLVLWGYHMQGAVIHILLITVSTLGIKTFLIPFLLFRSVKEANVTREVEPFVSLHLSILAASVIAGISFWLAHVMPLPVAASSPLLLPVAFATVLIGFLILVSRKKAITQIIGYLMLENGIFIFGQLLAESIPFLIEMCILLDLLVGVLVMGIAIHHISREFDHIDTELLSDLKD